ncbi:tyrosine-type recombinase/integrase [Desulfosporosinus sp. BICA1-9]|uniref:tyrosine-type recombinase/integrase n=1 Tax=Desulfosporosinus sp. BICA1-9 TaxID=1531958 RepID=UPI00054B493C|nr:tyrosine-type recombinase/integrase [Desulfosporosinus sp. BICA1-9]KJS47533.1 MAG: integrase [Peptococcaceae bacterium BRH_c23]KJS87167.1 MAG: integrase [Desulfosporosinus sp. BICA1-9]HBW38795.1 integrase [Desulfosporosinus sp.]
MTEKRTSAKKKAKELAKHLRGERPDYAYLKSLFQHLRAELEIEIPKTSKKLPYVPTEEELKRYYDVVWKAKNFQDMMIVKTLLYTGARVSELINIKLTDVDFHYCQIRINKGKGNKDRIVPFPQSFKELLAMHADSMIKKQAVYLFESSWKKKYTDRGIRKILGKYSEEAGLAQNLSPHKLRHFLLTWLKKQGIDDALIQPYSGHKSRKSLEVYSKLAITEAQQEYNEVINKFPI